MILVDFNRYLDQIERYFNVTDAVWVTGIAMLVAIAVFACCYRRFGAARAAQAAGWALLGGSIVVVAIFTLDRVTGPGTQVSNWTPLAGIYDELHDTSRQLAAINILGNVALFAPTGFLAALLLRPAWTALAVTPALSTAIEVTQQYIGLSADIDDIILNSVGGSIAAAVGLAIRWLWRTRTRTLTGAHPTKGVNKRSPPTADEGPRRRSSAQYPPDQREAK